MKKRKQLFNSKEPYGTEGTKTLFFEAVKENFLFQYENCPEYKKIADRYAITPESLTSYEDIAKIPPLPTVVFKRRRLFSIPKRKMLITATSSGTKGKFSEVGFEAGGLLCGLKMVLKVAKLRSLISKKPCHYIMLGYKYHRGNNTAVTKTAFGSTFFAPALSRTYALTFKNGQYNADLDVIIDAIVKHSKSHFPVRFMGFPSYTWFVMKLMEERGITVKLPKGSIIMLGGGWKQFYAEQTDKESFYALANKVFGVDDSQIVEFFGAVEHPILYCDCKNHHFHVPVYSRVMIRDVNTLKPLENGRVGLVNLITPMVKATPILSIMTDDLGILHDGKECGCGIDSPYLEIIGRVGMKEIKTCAAGAADILKDVKL